MMADNFSFNAPQFFDFSKGDTFEESSDIEAYFEMDHEGDSTPSSKENKTSEKGDCKLENVPSDPLDLENCEEGNVYLHIETEVECVNEVVKTEQFECVSEGKDHCGTPENCTEISMDELTSDNRLPGLRRSMSVGNILPKGYCQDDSGISTLSNHMEKLHMSSDKLHTKQRTNHSRELKERLNMLSQPKRRFASTEDLRANKYVSFAELVNKFQQGTPTRFRSKPNNVPAARLKNTVPHSPALSTKNRVRPAYALSQEEKEKKEFEEARKFKIKAHPISKRVMQGPLKPQQPVAKRPPTVPEPFKITSYPKKVSATPEKKEQYQFHARPIPKGVLEPPKPIQKLHQCTETHTPEFMKRIARKTPTKELNKDKAAKVENKPFIPSRTKPEPFSFEKRDKTLGRRREELINKVLDEEKRAREFHAHPVPKSVLRSPSRKNSSATSTCSSSRQASFTSSVKSYKSEENINTLTQFKAKPAKVLTMKPFQPKKGERPLTEIVPFELHSQRRAKEREEFEQKLKLKEEIISAYKREEEEKLKQMEEEEIARLRKEAEYKAKPIIQYKEVKIVPSNKVTEPISPQFHTDRLRNKENISNN